MPSQTDDYLKQNPAYGLLSPNAPVAQRIEYDSPKVGIRVRFPAGVFFTALVCTDMSSSLRCFPQVENRLSFLLPVALMPLLLFGVASLHEYF